MKYAKIIKIKDIKIENLRNFFSIIFFIVGPKLAIRNATMKNLDPLVIRDMIIK